MAEPSAVSVPLLNTNPVLRALESAGLSLMAALIRWPPLRTRVWKRIYEASARPTAGVVSELNCLNYGYAATDGSTPALSLEAGEAMEALSLQLYDHVVRMGTRSLAGLDVLEVGCGRGGGAAYLHRTFAPARLLGVDFSEGNVALCHDRHRSPGLDFQVANAERLEGIDETSFDAVLNVESAHCYASRLDFLRAVGQVLRPGGELLLADVFQKRIHLPSFEKAVADSGLVVTDRQDITANVLESRRQVLPLSLELTEGLSTGERTRVLNWAAVEGSRVYGYFESGRFCYLTWVLQRP